jgi:hypothetical protein
MNGLLGYTAFVTDLCGVWIALKYLLGSLRRVVDLAGPGLPIPAEALV